MNFEAFDQLDDEDKKRYKESGFYAGWTDERKKFVEALCAAPKRDKEKARELYDGMVEAENAEEFNNEDPRIICERLKAKSPSERQALYEDIKRSIEKESEKVLGEIRDDCREGASTSGPDDAMEEMNMRDDNLKNEKSETEDRLLRLKEALDDANKSIKGKKRQLDDSDHSDPSEHSEQGPSKKNKQSPTEFVAEKEACTYLQDRDLGDFFGDDT